MELRRFDSIEEFYRRAEPFLLEREAEHNLILGICTGLMLYPQRIEALPYMATIEDDRKILAVALRTLPHNLVLSYVAANEAIPLLARELYDEYKTLPGVISSVPFSKTFAEEWQRLTNQPYELAMPQRIYQLEKVNPVTGVPGSLRRAGIGDRDLLSRWLAEFNKEALGEIATPGFNSMVDRFLDSETQGIYLWEDEQPVSMAGFSRPTPNGIVIVAVYTPRQNRGKGYASACVAALSQLLLDQGRKYCFLYTDLANPTSNHIYRTIGYVPVCDADMYRFGG